MHYKVLFLIINSYDIPQYSVMKDIIDKYMSLFSTEVKYIFIDNDINSDKDIIYDEDNNMLVVKNEESIRPGIIIKTVAAYKYIISTEFKHTFDYVIRTNLSTFWNIFNLLNFLKTAPKTGFLSGFTVCDFISGTGIITSNDILYNIDYDILQNDIYNNYDDVLISYYLKQSYTNSMSYNLSFFSSKKYENYIIDKYDWVLLHDNNYNTDRNIDYDKILCYRIKNENRDIDIYYMIYFLEKIYKIKL